VTSRLTKEHRNLLTTFRDLGGKATTRQIAERVHLSVNGVAQSMGVLEKRGLVKRLNYKAGDSDWELVEQEEEQDPQMEFDLQDP